MDIRALSLEHHTAKGNSGEITRIASEIFTYVAHYCHIDLLFHICSSHVPCLSHSPPSKIHHRHRGTNVSEAQARTDQFPVCMGRVAAAAIFRSRFPVNTWVVEALRGSAVVVAVVEARRTDHNRVVVVARNRDRRLLVHLCLGLVFALCCVISATILDSHRHSIREEVPRRATFLVVEDSREVEDREALLASDVVEADHRIVVVDSSHHFQEAYVEVGNDAAVDIVVEVEWAVMGLLPHRQALPEEDHHCRFLHPVSAAC